jgi:hypothetical protein
VVEHSIGNGEVDSSILSGSTIHPIEIQILLAADFGSPACVNAWAIGAIIVADVACIVEGLFR